VILPIKDDNPTSTTPWVTVSIVAINIVVFLYSFLLGDFGFDVFTQRMGLIPFEIVHAVDAVSPTPIPLYFTILTSMFMHGGWMHLGGNLLYLWIFGNSVEETLGPVRFLLFYLFCGISATAAHVISGPDSMVPLVGASGAIAGVLGAYLSAFPGTRVHVLVFLIFFIQIVRVPALLVLGSWFIIQVFSATTETTGGGSGVAWYAHIVGFLVGYLLMWGRIRRLTTFVGRHWEREF
jgi:membrane associated rhomboid family serine protease